MDLNEYPGQFPGQHQNPYGRVVLRPRHTLAGSVPADPALQPVPLDRLNDSDCERLWDDENLRAALRAEKVRRISRFRCL